MAKKRRKPRTRRTQSASRAGTTTAPRPAGKPSGGSATSARPSGGAPTGPSSEASRQRAARKELARAERDAARKRLARQNQVRRLVWGGAIGLLIAAGVLYFTRDTTTTRPSELPGELRTEAPWPANGEQAQARSDAIGLPPEGSAMHIHANLRIFVHGEGVVVPTDVGIDRSGTPPFVASLHTHEASGTIHMESSQQRTFTLGEFFDVWGVRLSASCIGAYCNDAQNTLQVFVGGQEVTGSIRNLELGDQDVLVVTYGTADELPSPIPSSFDFGSVPQ